MIFVIISIMILLLVLTVNKAIRISYMFGYKACLYSMGYNEKKVEEMFFLKFNRGLKGRVTRKNRNPKHVWFPKGE